LPRSVHLKNSARDGVSSRLDSRILRRYRHARPGSPPCIALPVTPPDEVASYPASCIFRLCRRWNFELPRTSHPSTPPAVKLQVSLQLRCARCASRCVPGVDPVSASSGLAGDGSSSRPEKSHPSAQLQLKPWVTPQLALQLRLPMIHRVAPVWSSSGFAGDGVSSCPGSRILWHLRGMRRGFPRSVARPAAPPSVGCEFPHTLHLPALPRSKDFGSPRIPDPLAPAGGSPSFLGSRTLRLCRPCVFEFPRILHLRLGR